MSMSIVVQFGPGLQEEDANMGEHLLKNYIAGGRGSWQMVIFPCLGKMIIFSGLGKKKKSKLF